MSHFRLHSLRGVVPNRWDVVLLPLVIAGLFLLAWASQGESRHRSDRLPILTGKVMECRPHIGTDVEAGQSNLLNHGGQMAVLFGEQ